LRTKTAHLSAASQSIPSSASAARSASAKVPTDAFLDGCPWDAIVMVDTAEVEKEVGAMAI